MIANSFWLPDILRVTDAEAVSHIRMCRGHETCGAEGGDTQPRHSYNIYEMCWNTAYFLRWSVNHAAELAVALRGLAQELDIKSATLSSLRWPELSSNRARESYTGTTGCFPAKLLSFLAERSGVEESLEKRN